MFAQHSHDLRYPQLFLKFHCKILQASLHNFHWNSVFHAMFMSLTISLFSSFSCTFYASSSLFTHGSFVWSSCFHFHSHSSFKPCTVFNLFFLNHCINVLHNLPLSLFSFLCLIYLFAIQRAGLCLTLLTSFISLPHVANDDWMLFLPQEGDLQVTSLLTLRYLMVTTIFRLPSHIL